MTEVLGWVSSIVLLATIVTQIVKQFRERSGKGISPWLFVGQTVASVGFTAYSALLHNWVFTVTNALMLVSAIVGWVITWHFKRRGSGAPASGGEGQKPAGDSAPAEA
jgi:MtN3 and saliva related transmembrane protein